MSAARPHDGARWVVECDGRPGMEWNRHIVDNEGWPVCFMTYSDGTDIAGEAQKAYMVAAAPALLAALRELVRICERCDADGPMADACGEDEYQAAMDAAEDAIALALMTKRSDAQQPSKQVTP